MISKVFIFLISASLYLTVEASTLDLVTFNYPPFLQSNELGFVDKLLIDFKSNTSIKFNTHKFPVKRALNYYKTKKYYLHLGAADNFSKEELSKSYILPIFDLNVYLLFSKTNKDKLQKDLTTLKNIRIGILRGAQQEEDFANKYNFSITTYTDSENAFNLLKKGRVDFITFSPLFYSHEDIVGESTLDDFIYHKDLCYKTEAAFFISKSHKNSKDIYEEFNKKLSLYLKSPQYKKLLVKTFTSSIPEGVLKYTKE
ncbi:hypothetical protein [Halobacteriovorax sp.]|uniref:hypothetical protein n=1 Tax=Halobacteriovorax sp. TaxID=2020862 RepID=UPI00356B5A70